MIIAAKCTPEKELLEAVKNSGINAVELFLSKRMMNDAHHIVQLCNSFPFRYALHAPNDCYKPSELLEIVHGVGAEVVVFHDLFWEHEWVQLYELFKNVNTKICVENIFGDDDPIKFIRRFGFQRCLDVEHLQMQCAGLYEHALMAATENCSHVHLTGYRFGSELWHTHIHDSPEHNLRVLDLLLKSGYSGFVVSEADASFQTYGEFKKLYDFFNKWKVSSSA